MGTRSRSTVGAGVVTAGTVALTMVLVGCGGDGGGTGASPAGRPSDGKSASATTAARTSAEPSPSKSYPLSKTPQTIPSVREHTPAARPRMAPHQRPCRHHGREALRRGQAHRRRAEAEVRGQGQGRCR